MRALLLLLAIPAVLWLIQTLLLRAGGHALRRSLSPPDLPSYVKRGNRIATYIALATAIAAYPLLRQRTPWEYYRQFLPASALPHDLVWGLSAAVLYLVLLYLAWLLADLVRFNVRHSPQRLVRRLLSVPLTAALVAFVEELLFRAMLFAELLETCTLPVAFPLAVITFAAAHYVRAAKRRWTFPGHIALGTLFCLAFLLTRTLWLPIGLHAGGVVVLMGVRPFIRYRGPAWLIGASIFPYAGALGVLALGQLSLNLWLRFGCEP